MTNNPTLATMLLTAVLATGPLGATTIDDLQLAQSVDTGGTAATEVTAGGGELVLGGARDLAVVSDGSAVTAVAGGGQLVFQVPPGTTGAVEAVWDGEDAQPQILDPAGLGSVDLTDAGSHDALALTVLSASGVTLMVEIHSDAGSWSAAAFAVPETDIATPYLLPYSMFATGAGAGARFDDVGAVVVRIEGSDEAQAVIGPITTVAASPQIVVTQRDLDATALGGGTGSELGSNPRSPGGTYTLTMTLSNTGDEATGVWIDELLDPDLFAVGAFRSTPIVRDDRYATCFSAPVIADGTAAPGLIEGSGNDYDPDGQFLTVVALQSVSGLGGTVTLDDAGTGRFTYLPPPGLTGVDRFTYTVADVDGNAAEGEVLVSLKTADQCAGCDHDGDGSLHPSCGGSDCDDFRADVHPGADELCDGVDNDCDGEIDEGYPPDCVPCDFIDNPECTPGDVRRCGSDVGMCVAGTEVCDATGSWSGACDGAVEPVAELANGLDDDCDGTADEDQWPITTPCPDAGNAWRVMAGAAPGGDGLTWATAFATIDEALAAASSCDEIWVGGTHTLPATVVIDSPIRIYGGFQGTEVTRDERDPETNVTALDGGGAVRCFEITAGTLLDGVTVSNCFNDTTSEGGAIEIRGAILHVRDGIFTGNVNFQDADSAHGGAIAALDGAGLFIEGSHFEGNHSRYRGGAIAVLDADALLRDTVLVDNVAADENGQLGSGGADGGAVYALGGGTVAILGSTFEGNRSGSNAIFVRDPDLYVLDSVFRDHGCTFSSCPADKRDAFSQTSMVIVRSTAVLHGSLFETNGVPPEMYDLGILGPVVEAIYGAAVTVSGCEFADNHNPALKGRTYDPAEITTLDIADSRFSGNVGSLTTIGVPLTVSNTRFERDRQRFWTVSVNSIQEPHGNASFTGCTFADNFGTGLRLDYVDATIDRSVFVRNAGHFYGGALELDRYVDLRVTNSLLADNTCDDTGAAAFVDDHSSLELEHVTVVGNRMADPFGAAVRAEYHSSVAVTNSVVWGNWPRAMLRDSTSDLISSTYSVVPDEFGWGDPSLHNVVEEPALVDPGAGDYRLSAWSPALDAANPGTLTLDFDGRTRDFDGDGDGVGEPDPGAYEYVDAVPNLPPVAVAVDDVLVAANGVPLTDALLSSDRTCDPNGDFLSYTWYGPGGLLSGADPQVLLPQGISLLTLVSDDGALPSQPITIDVEVQPCQDLTAVRTGDDAQVTWTEPGPGDLYRAVDSRPFQFALAASQASSGLVDSPPSSVHVALYAVLSDQCASDVEAVYVGDAPPANSPPVIWSRPADYSDSLHLPYEPITQVTARFGIPYASHVRAADPDGDPLAYSLVEGPLGAGLASDGLFTWVPDQTGQHPVTVEVTDGNGGTATQSFTIQVDNRPPTADAGRSHTLSETGVTVTLDGSGSSDPDGDPLSFAWQLVSAPMDSTASLSDPSADQPELTPDLPGRYEVALVVDDGALASVPDTTFVETHNVRPVAVTTYPNVPGDHDSTHWRGELVELDGSGSWDPEDRPLSYDWTITRQPAGSQVRLDDPTDPRPSFVIDLVGEYDVELVVSDGERTSAPAWSFLAARNRDPVADPGPDRNAAVGDTVTHDCSRSSDPDGHPLDCLWRLTPPAGSSATIIGHPPGSTDWYRAEEASFMPDIAGEYWMRLVVQDPLGGQDGHTAIVTVQPGTNPPLITTTPPLTALVGHLWTYDADATDPDPGDTATWSLVAAPAGMTVDAATGEVAWTPADSQVGDHEVELHVTDSTGWVDAQPFTLTAALEPAPPRLGCPAALTVVEAATLGHLLSAADPNDDPLTFAKLSGPPAATVDDGELVWPTVVGDAGVHTLGVRVTDGALDDTCSIEITVVAGDEDDGDFDGWTEIDGDCDDTDPTVNPGAIDIAGDGIDQDCDGADAVRSVAADGPTATLELLVGESVWIPHTIYVDRPDGASGDLELTQQVDPASGLQLDTDFDDPPTVTGGLTRTATVRATAVLPGEYQVTTTVTDTVTGAQGVVSTPVRVLDGATSARMPAPGLVPGAVPEGEATLVDVAVRLLGGETAVDAVWLDRTDATGTPVEGLGWLADDGGGADLAAGDGVFSRTILVPASPEGTLHYRAVTVGSPTVASEVATLAVTRFPVGPPEGDLDDVVFHPTSGSEVLAGQVGVTFVPGATPAEIESAATDLGAAVAGYLPGLEVYVLTMPPLTGGHDLAARLAAVEAHPLVDAADYSNIVELEEVTEPDPLKDEPSWLGDINAKSAWVFGFDDSSVATAVVDTGVDRYHPELKLNFQTGVNLIQSPFGVQDLHAHGTQVSGIFAADSNTVGFAGVLPSNRPEIHRAFDEGGRSNTLLMVHGLVAAANRGARLINASFGEFRAETQPALMESVDEFLNGVDSLLIAAAGNENTSRPLFPAANAFSLAVGGVETDIARRWNPPNPWTGSNHGPWVDIAAPAENVLTTQPTDRTTDWNADTQCVDYTAPGYPLLPTLAERRAKGCYGTVSGTSMSTPMAVGVAGMVLDRFPHYNALEVRKRLEETAVPRTGPLALGLGHGLIDAQQAVFNGGFEAAEVHSRALMRYGESLYWRPRATIYNGWLVYEPCQKYGTTATKPENHGWHLMRYGGIPYQFGFADSVQALAGTFARRLGPIVPVEGDYMAMLSTGRAAESHESIYSAGGTDYWTAQYLDILEQTFTIAPGQSTLTVSFMYDFVTEEAPNIADRLDWPSPDLFYAVIETSDRREMLILRNMWDMENQGALSAVSGVVLSGFPARHTGWQPVHEVINIDPSETGPITIRFGVYDGSARDLDSVLLIDEVRIE